MGTTKKGKSSKQKAVRPIGRPTKYDPKYCDEIIEFFSIEPTREIVIENTSAKGDTYYTTKILPNRLPTFARFARTIGVNKDTLIEWATATANDGERVELRHPDFSDAYNAAKELQKEFLVDNGLAGLSPPASFIFTAKNITDMRDKIETDVTSGGQKLTPFEAILSAMNPAYDRRKPPAVHIDDSDETRV